MGVVCMYCTVYQLPAGCGQISRLAPTIPSQQKIPLTECRSGGDLHLAWPTNNIRYSTVRLLYRTSTYNINDDACRRRYASSHQISRPVHVLIIPSGEFTGTVLSVVYEYSYLLNEGSTSTTRLVGRGTGLVAVRNQAVTAASHRAIA